MVIAASQVVILLICEILQILDGPVNLHALRLQVGDHSSAAVQHREASPTTPVHDILAEIAVVPPPEADSSHVSWPIPFAMEQVVFMSTVSRLLSIDIDQDYDKIKQHQKQPG